MTFHLLPKHLLKARIILIPAFLIIFSIVAIVPHIQAQDKNVTIAHDNDPSVIYLNAIHINIHSPEAKALRKAADNFPGRKMHLITFKGAMQPEWYKIMTDAGAEVIDYIPNYTYLVYITSNALQHIQDQSAKANSPVAWDGEYLADYRISPAVYGKDAKGRPDKNTIAGNKFSLQLYADPATNAETISIISRMQLNAISGKQAISHYINMVVRLSPQDLMLLAERPDVISINPYIEPKKNDESQGMIMSGQLTGNSPTPGNYLSYLAGKGFLQSQFDASGFVVNVTDGGLDSGSVANVANPTRHFALYKGGDMLNPTRVAFIHKQGTAGDADTKGCEGHGNINTHIIGGYIPDALLASSIHTDANGFRYGLGVAPFVKVGNSTIFTFAGSYASPNLSNLEAESYRDGGRISSNSWGANTAGGYNSDAQSYDLLVRDAQPASSSVPVAGNQEMVIVFAAGNAGSGAGTIGSPGAAKNVLTVGASEGVRTFGAADGCGIADAEANSANDVVSFSSRGPCSDGRKKPDIMAPGTHITGGVFPNSLTNLTSGTGAASPCFDASGVCGGTAGSHFYPGTQQWYTTSSGTSHSTPAVSGFAALVRQHFINNSLTPPSPAMTKAVIMNSAGYMNGVSANDNLYSNNQGMGLVNMNNFFNQMGSPKIIRDEVAADMFTGSGQTRTRGGVIASSAQPVRITLAYSDVAGSTTGNSYVNNLDLEVTVNGIKYFGNVFSGANSVTGGAADVRNNVESVFLPAGTTGNIIAKVIATNIAGDGVPNTGGALDQDYALVMSNVTEQPIAAPFSTGAVLTTESCGSGLVPDPGELLTLSLPVSNDGTAATTNLVATLEANADVVNPGPAQAYGALAPGASVSMPFSFYVNNTVPCGSNITLTWDLLDGTSNLGTITKVYTVGALQPTINQNFDAVAVPALPAGWTQNQTSGNGITWGTSVTTPNSAPNCAFANDPATVNAAALETPSFLVSSAAAAVTFQKAYTVENSFDGVVLEIKIGAGAWTDILAAGGSFVNGGYTGTISTGYASPIGGRQAWTGTSASFTATHVSLPPAALGQNVQLRWLMASDNSTASTGFRLDNVLISSTVACTPCNSLPLTLLSFTGIKKEGYNLLEWKTAHEINTRSFEIEYAVDGINFKTGYSQEASGNGNNIYYQRDNGSWIQNALIYYRLKMIDNDGRSGYSNVISIRNNSFSQASSILYPNPAKDMVTLSVGSKGLLGTTARLMDVSGKQLEIIPVRYTTVSISLGKYAPGSYMLRLQNGESLKLIKL